MVRYIENNVFMKWTTCFIHFTGWIPLKYGSTTTPPFIAHCQKNLYQALYKTYPEFWPSHKQILKTMRFILENWR